MKEITDLREIMDEFTDVEFGVEILITVLHMLESYCDLEKKGIAIIKRYVFHKVSKYHLDEMFRVKVSK